MMMIVKCGVSRMFVRLLMRKFIMNEIMLSRLLRLFLI